MQSDRIYLLTSIKTHLQRQTRQCLLWFADNSRGKIQCYLLRAHLLSRLFVQNISKNGHTWISKSLSHDKRGQVWFQNSWASYLSSAYLIVLSVNKKPYAITMSGKLKNKWVRTLRDYWPQHVSIIPRKMEKKLPRLLSLSNINLFTKWTSFQSAMYYGLCKTG